MKASLVIGLIVLVLGIVSLFVPVPRHESEGIRAGDVSIGVQIKHEEKVPVWVSGLLIGGGLGIIALGSRR